MAGIHKKTHRICAGLTDRENVCLRKSPALQALQAGLSHFGLSALPYYIMGFQPSPKRPKVRYVIGPKARNVIAWAEGPGIVTPQNI